MHMRSRTSMESEKMNTEVEDLRSGVVADVLDHSSENVQMPRIF